jgi:transposase InsO family protein
MVLSLSISPWVKGLDCRGRCQKRLHRAGQPWENGYIESFNARLRDELLDGEIFYTLRKAKIVIESWRRSAPRSQNGPANPSGTEWRNSLSLAPLFRRGLVLALVPEVQ